MMKDKIRKFWQRAALVYATALLFPLTAAAQAYDGDGDWKIYGGYVNFEGIQGFEMGCMRGLSDQFSISTYVSMLPKTDKWESDFGALRGYDLGAQFDVHGAYLLNLPSWLDIYAGPKVSFASAGLGAGLRINFSEEWGFYGYAQKNLVPVFDNQDNGKHSPYYKKFGFAIGITFTFL